MEETTPPAAAPEPTPSAPPEPPPPPPPPVETAPAPHVPEPDPTAGAQSAAFNNGINPGLKIDIGVRPEAGLKELPDPDDFADIPPVLSLGSDHSAPPLRDDFRHDPLFQPEFVPPVPPSAKANARLAQEAAEERAAELRKAKAELEAVKIKVKAGLEAKQFYPDVQAELPESDPAAGVIVVNVYESFVRFYPATGRVHHQSTGFDSTGWSVGDFVTKCLAVRDAS